MSRPPRQPDRSEIPQDELPAYDHIVARSNRLKMPGSDGKVVDPYWGALLNAPSYAYGLAEMGRLARTGQVRGAYTDAQRELVDMVMSVDFKYNAILHLHIPDALAVGTRIEAIDALRSGQEELLTDEEKLITEYTRAVIAGTSTDALFDRMTELMTHRGAIEFTIFIAFLLQTFRIWQALGVPDFTDAEVDELLDGFRTGKVELPDPMQRIG